MQVDSRVAIEVERIQLYGKKLNLLVVKTTLVLMLLAMSFLASGSDVHAANGNFVWAKSMGGASTDQGLDIAVDGSGSVYTTGAFQGTMDFDPGPGTFNLTSNGNEDVFVSKLDSNGDFVWAKTIGGAGTDQGLGIAVDGSGNVHTTGLFDGTMDFDPGPGAYNLIGSGVSDIFVSKLDSNGDFVWAKSMSGRRSTGRGIAVDGEGNVHVTGFFIGTGDFDPGPGTFNLTGSEVSDVFIPKLDSNGNFVWAKSMAGRNVARGYGIAVDGSGNVHTVGRFVRTVDFEPGSSAFVIKSSGDRDIFVSKLDNNGNFVWAKSMGGTNMARGNGITVDGSGNVYTVGRFEGMVDFDPGSGSFNLTSSDGSDVFVSKLGIDGNFVWAKSVVVQGKCQG